MVCVDSGYRAAAEDWECFLKCWRDSVKDSYFWENSSQPIAVNATDLEAEFFKISGCKMPRSLVDFITACERLNMGTGGISISNMDIFSVVDREYISDYIDAAGGFDYSDIEYYSYGVGQELMCRPSLIGNSLVIGEYGGDRFEKIVLFPQVISSDGEMESMLLFHSRCFRATNFGELMRNLYYMELMNLNYIPPYREYDLINSCAKLLPMSVFW